MKKLRVLVLTHEDLIPPEDADTKSMEEMLAWKAEYDVLTALKELGHEAQIVGLSYDLTVLRRAIESFKPHITFNLLEEFYDIGAYDQHVAGYLELLTQAYTGCNPRGLMLSRDKVISKKILSYHRLSTPRFDVIPLRGRKTLRAKLEYPLLVKSAIEDASMGISQASVVHSEEKLYDRVSFIHSNVGSDALVEEYIEGRELYVGVLGNSRLTMLPIWELDLSKLPERAVPIATPRVKWNIRYQKEHKISSGPAKELSEELHVNIYSFCKRVYRRLYLSGYARIDMRLRDDGKIFLLEANANPDVSYGEDFAESAEHAGIHYPELIQKILNLGLRYPSGWKRAATLR